MISINGVKNTLASVNLFNINLRAEKQLNNKLIETQNVVEECIKHKKVYKDYKCSLGGWSLGLIGKMEGDLIAYLFIQKNKDESAWNLVNPIIIEKNTGKEYFFGLGYFALEGGGGLSKTESVIRLLMEHKNKGNNVSILPKVVDNKLLEDYGYWDSNLKTNDLLSDTIDLVNYQKNEFSHIYKKYQEIIEEYA